MSELWERLVVNDGSYYHLSLILTKTTSTMIPYSYFVHPEDEKALNAMKAVPGFETVVKKFLKIGYETQLHGVNMASKIQLSENQLPEIYHRVTRVCDKFGIEYPEVYLEMSPFPNAYTFGDTQIFMVLTSALFDYLDDDEIDSVIAHECGHIVCHHVLYHTIAEFLRTGMTGILGSIAEPLKLAVYYWERKSELSADRAAALICGVDTIVRTQLRLAGGPKSLTSAVNIEEWAEQAERYEAIRNGNTWDKILQVGATMTLDHPFSAVRVREVLNWSKTEEFDIAMKVAGGENRMCPHCHKAIDNDWAFCKHCGGKL